MKIIFAPPQFTSISMGGREKGDQSLDISFN